MFFLDLVGKSPLLAYPIKFKRNEIGTTGWRLSWSSTSHPPIKKIDLIQFINRQRKMWWWSILRKEKLFVNLTFMGLCIVKIFQYISNKMQRYTVYFIWKLLYMFRVVPPPTIKGACKYIYSIWYLSHRYCYLPLVAGSSNGLTNTRCCRYSCLRSWWWVELPPETCRVVSG